MGYVILSPAEPPLEHAGLSGAALYVGSWSEQCRSGRERVP